MQAKHGGAEGNRTPDLDIANVALSRLSYGPRCWNVRFEQRGMAAPANRQAV